MQSGSGLHKLLRTTTTLAAHSLKETGSAIASASQQQDNKNVSSLTENLGRRSLLADLSGSTPSNEGLTGLRDRRWYASQAEESKRKGDIHVDIKVPYKLHLLDEGPAQEITTTREELLKIYRLMQTMRWMEIQADMVQFYPDFLHHCIDS